MKREKGERERTNMDGKEREIHNNLVMQNDNDHNIDNTTRHTKTSTSGFFYFSFLVVR